MGPSGAGKTSLLNVLAGRRGEAASGKFAEIAGKLRVNGEIVDPHFVKRVSGYVTQEDVLPETLTCYEHLMFHAELRMRGVNKDARRARVMEVCNYPYPNPSIYSASLFNVHVLQSITAHHRAL